MTKYVRAAIIGSVVGLIVVTLYLIVFRFFISHVPLAVELEQLMQWDASNAYGDAAFSGGWNMAAAGAAMDVVVSTVWAVVFVYAYANFGFVRRSVLLSGFLLGVVVWIVMIYAVVPLGHARAGTSALAIISTGIAHTLFFGVPLMWVVKKEVG
jgi:hypothetical protein